MFERFIRLARTRKALQEGRCEAAIQLSLDPLIREDRRAERVRDQAKEQLLSRARQRAAAGDLSAAMLDVERAMTGGDCPAAQDLAARLRSDLATREAAQRAAQAAVAQARQLAERGQLAAAQEQLAAGKAAADQPQARSVEQFLAARRQRAIEHRRTAEQQLEAGDLEAALTEFQRLQAVDADLAEAQELRRRLLASLAETLASELDAALAAGELEVALSRVEQRIAALPEVQAAAAVVPPLRRLTAILRQRLGEVPATPAGLALLRRVAALPRILPGAEGAAVHEAAAAMIRAADQRAQGRLPELADTLEVCADQLDSPSLRREAGMVREQAVAHGQKLEQARASAETGDLVAARAAITSILEAWPMHWGARKELDLIDATNQDRERRLAAARQAAREARLGEASALALALVVPGRAGEEARLLLKDVRSRQDLVSSGLDQVRASLHGRQAATSEGVRHCLLRLEELAKVQTDHPDLDAAMAALRCELEGLAAIDNASQALLGSDLRAARAAIEPLAGLRPRLLSPDRLDARVQALGDRLLQAGETALQAGRLGDVGLCEQGLGLLWGLDPGALTRLQDMQQRAAAQNQRAEELLQTARNLLAARDVDAAERCLQDARQLCLDLPAVQRLEGELQRLRQHQGTLQRVEVLAKDRDFDGANRRLADLPPTPPMLRTRIFDMKQSLARAQGLEGAFVLRVDEGGEFVVLRGETVSIGNVRDGRADLAILANIAGRHASIQRSMSFHGGMQDCIAADGGELRIGGKLVTQPQVLQSGDRIQLGPSLQIDYRLPTNRSLTASLTLLGGFQVAGTDRVLLFKDRGRDGRILLSCGKDGHVQVAAATGEVEIFAHKTGQMRVRCDDGGRIDGRPFKGEHPVDAGAMVEAKGISFVLLPLQRHA